MIPDLRRNERFEMVMWLVALALLALLASVLLAKAAEPCLTKQEARAKWPNRHIFWHTSERCWDINKTGGRHYGKRESKPKEDNKPRPAPPARADASGNDVNSIYVKESDYNALDAQADKQQLTVLYPTLMPLADPPSTLMLTPTVMTRWSSMLIDVDAQRTFAPWAYRAAGAWER